MRKAKEEDPPSLRIRMRNNRLTTTLVVVSVILSFLMIFLPRTIANGQALYLPKNIEVGEVSSRTVVLRRPLVYQDIPATKALQKQRAEEALPVFSYNNSVVFQVRNTLETVAKALSSKEQFEARLFVLEEIFSPSEIAYLRESTNKLSLFPLIGEFSDRILEYGVVDEDQYIRYKKGDEIIIKEQNYIKQSSQKVLADKDIILLSTIPEVVSFLVLGLGITDSDETFIQFLLSKVLTPNLFYNHAESSALLESYVSSVSPVFTKVPPATTVVEKGEVIGEEEYYILQAIKEQKNQGTPIFQYIGLVVYLLLIYFVSYKSWVFFDKTNHRFSGRGEVILIAFILWQIFTLVAYVIGVELFYDHYMFFVPTVIFVVGVSVFLGNIEAIAFSCFLGVFQVLLPGVSLMQGLTTIGFGLSGAYFLQSVEQRIDIVRVLNKIIFCHLGITALFLIFQQETLQTLGITLAIVAINNSLWFIICIFSLPFWEKVSSIPTIFSLQELADMSLPIFQRMRNVAPGTYSHSLAVAELAESAAMEIGVNKYIAKVGACYHDIGKLDQPEYFIENQIGMENKHDTLKPTLSVSIIKAHVKLGEQKAKELGLPQEIIDVIVQHHGNDMIAYFYFEAMKDAGITQVEAMREEGNFRYHGTPPQSKESAIVMLADAVEAASRTLVNPNAAKLDKLIWKIITDKIVHDQLTGSSLSMMELKAIKEAFLATSLGRFHGRIRYPNQEETP